MTDGRTALVVGNWKMNGTRPALAEAEALAQLLAGGLRTGVTVVLCPPATLLAKLSDALGGSPIRTGGQDCHPEAAGAHTGDIGAPMLADAGAAYVIVGHSERRTDHREGDELVGRKAAAAFAAGLLPIICVGETEAERRAGEAEAVVRRQLAGSVPAAGSGQAFAIAYEPVWAIGTGLTATIEDIDAMHGAIRAALVERFGGAGAAVPILYGGSVKPANAAAILARPEVGGALVGGASLLAKDFFAIISAA